MIMGDQDANNIRLARSGQQLSRVIRSIDDQALSGCLIREQPCVVGEAGHEDLKFERLVFVMHTHVARSPENNHVKSIDRCH